MTARTACLALVLLAGCATASPEPVFEARSTAAPLPEATPSPAPPPDAAAAARPTPGPRPSDWALTVVGTPFVLGFRAVVCAASTVVAGPMAALFAVSADPRGGFAYLRDGLAYNCGPPYGVPLPTVADRGREPAARYAPPDLGPPRRLTPYASAELMGP
jgi:hypothetical protein